MDPADSNWLTGWIGDYPSKAAWERWSKLLLIEIDWAPRRMDGLGCLLARVSTWDMLPLNYLSVKSDLAAAFASTPTQNEE